MLQEISEDDKINYQQNLKKMDPKSYEEFLKLGYEEFSMKLNSLPETEPLFKIIKSRAINVNKIKDKDERRYWRELKKINKIPDIYKSNDELDIEMKSALKNNQMGG